MHFVAWPVSNLVEGIIFHLPRFISPGFLPTILLQIFQIAFVAGLMRQANKEEKEDKDEKKETSDNGAARPEDWQEVHNVTDSEQYAWPLNWLITNLMGEEKKEETFPDQLARSENWRQPNSVAGGKHYPCPLDWDGLDFVAPTQENISEHASYWNRYVSVRHDRTVVPADDLPPVYVRMARPLLQRKPKVSDS